MLTKIRTVLIRPSHPRNIGASARSLKTMGLSQLYLVSPKLFPSEEANNLASHAVDVLEKAKVVDSLSEALEGCQLVFATSSRKRFIQWPSLTPREAAQKIKQYLSPDKKLEFEPDSKSVALLFGNEKHGLSNEELETSQYQIYIPTCPDYTSLNLAQSLQIIAYELYLALSEQGETALNEGNELNREEPLANAEELHLFYVVLERLLEDIQFSGRRPGSGYLMPRLKRLFARAAMSKSELNLLRGILTAIQKRV